MIKTVAFRVDANSKIGAGHLIRSLVLAKKYKNKRVVFCSYKMSDNFVKLIKENGYESIGLKTD